MMSKWVMEKGERKRSRAVHWLWREMDGDAITVRTRLMEVAWTRSHVHTCAAAKGHVWVHNPIAAKVCVDVHGQSYHQRHCRCPVSGLLPKVILMFQSFADLTPPLLTQGELVLLLTSPSGMGEPALEARPQGRWIPIPLWWMDRWWANEGTKLVVVIIIFFWM